MRYRFLDLGLFLALVVVAGGIMWTLFSLGSPARLATDRPPPDAPAASVPAAEAPPPVALVVPTPVPGLTPAAPAAAPVVAPTAPGATPAAAEPAPAPPVAPAAPEPVVARTLPEGEFALERVGFSFVTGGPGSCGVVLQAWQHVAVSRDLLAEYGCGAQLRITLDDPAGGRNEALVTIADTMNPSFRRTVNVYVATSEPAFAYGLTTGTFAPR
jgi:hypothetical protein